MRFWPARLFGKPAPSPELPGNVVSMTDWIAGRSTERDTVDLELRGLRDTHDRAWSLLQQSIHLDAYGDPRPPRLIGNALVMPPLVVAAAPVRIKGAIAPVSVEFAVVGALAGPLQDGATQQQILEAVESYQIIATRRIHEPGKSEPTVSDPTVSYGLVKPDDSMSAFRIRSELDDIELLRHPLGDAEAVEPRSDSSRSEGVISHLGGTAVR